MRCSMWRLSYKKGVFFHPKNTRYSALFFPYLNIADNFNYNHVALLEFHFWLLYFPGFRTLNISSVMKNPVRLRNEVIFWAISANLTDLLMTDEEFLDNLMEANIKADEALTSDNLLKFLVNPKKAICQSDLPTKIIVSEKISSSDIQVISIFEYFSVFSTFSTFHIFRVFSQFSISIFNRFIYKSAKNNRKRHKTFSIRKQ